MYNGRPKVWIPVALVVCCGAPVVWACFAKDKNPVPPGTFLAGRTEEQMIEDLEVKEALARVQVKLTAYHLTKNKDDAKKAAKELENSLEVLESKPRMKRGLTWVDHNIDEATLAERPRSTKNWSILAGSKWDELTPITRLTIEATVQYNRLKERLRSADPSGYEYPYSTATIELILAAGMK